MISGKGKMLFDWLGKIAAFAICVAMTAGFIWLALFFTTGIYEILERTILRGA